MSDAIDPKPERQARRHHRRPVTRFIWYHTIETSDTAPVHGISYSVDLSKGGVGIIGNRCFGEGTLMMVQVVFDAAKFVVSAVCRVAHCAAGEQEGQYRLGLEFVVLPPDSSSFLSEHFT